MTDADKIKILEEKLDALINSQERLLAIFSGLFVEADTLTKIHGLNQNTISRNEKLEKFKEIGGRKILLKLEAVPVVKSLKRPKKRAKSSTK